MKIDEAIERLGKLRLPIKTQENHKDHEAVRLGIEALKRIQVSRKHFSRVFPTPLPGETKD